MKGKMKQEIRENQWMLTILMAILIGSFIVMLNLVSPEDLGYMIDAYAVALVISALLIGLILRGKIWK